MLIANLTFGPFFRPLFRPKRSIESPPRLFVAPSQKNPVNNYTFNLWCFHPGFSMKSLLNCGIRSLILTSGTLKPLSALSRELDINFQINFCGDHVVKREQGGYSIAL